MAAEIPQVVASVLISYPLGVAHWLTLFHQKHFIERAFERAKCRKLLVFGDGDQFTSVDLYRKLNDALGDADRNALQLVAVANADHFWLKRESALLEPIQTFLAANVSSSIFRPVPDKPI